MLKISNRSTLPLALSVFFLLTYVTYSNSTVIGEVYSDDYTLDRVLSYPGYTRSAYGGGGLCVWQTVYGSTAAGIGKKWVEMNNAVTTMQCFQACRNPAKFVGANESNLTFTVESLCGGARYTVKVREHYGGNSIKKLNFSTPTDQCLTK